MNAPAPAAATATVTAAVTAPAVASATVGHVVTFCAAPDKITPQALRSIVAARMSADLGPAAVVDVVKTVRGKSTTTRRAVFVDMLPEVITPVAALGLATRDAVVAATPKSPATRWIHAGQKDGVSRWIYTVADVTPDHARISGYSGAEARANGDLVIDDGIPAPIADTLRAAYDAARGVVEPAKINAAVARFVVDEAAGQRLNVGTYIVPTMTPALRAVLAAVADLGGFAGAYAVGRDDANAAALVAPVARSLEDDVAAVLAAVDDTIARATAAQAVDGPAFHEKSNDTAHSAIDDVRARLATWSDRLGVALADVSAKLSEADRALDAACDAALAAVARRKAQRAAATG